MTKKQQAALAVKLQQFNEWRMADPDIAGVELVTPGDRPGNREWWS